MEEDESFDLDEFNDWEAEMHFNETVLEDDDISGD
jgi:hypothetical protein